MKYFQTVLIAALAGTFVTAQAQEKPNKVKHVISKGTGLVSGSFRTDFTKQTFFPTQPNTTSLRTVNFSFQPRAGYFVADNLVVGALMGYTLLHTRDKAPGTWLKTNRHTISPGVFVRYYHMFTERFGIYGEFQAMADIAVRKTNSAAGLTNTDRIYGFNTGVSPRLVYFMSSCLAIEGGFGSVSYVFSKEQGTGNTIHSGGLRLSPDLTLGLSLYLGKGTVQK